MTVNLRPAGATTATGNRFGLSHVSLPVGRIGPLERVGALRDQGYAPDIDSAPVVDFALMAALGRGPAAVERLVMSFLGARASLALVHLDGGADTPTVCDVPVTAAGLWPPRPGNLGLGLGLVRLGDALRLCVISDAALIPDPQVIADGFNTAFEALVAVAPTSPPRGDDESTEEIIEEESALEESAKETPPVEPQRCAGTTKAGSRCKRRVKDGNTLCSTHSGQA